MNLQRVLVCDDSLTIRRLVSMVTSNLGIHLELAVNAAEGIRKAQETRPELILLDYVLPDGKGHDVLDQLEKSERTAGIPVVMMSAKGESLADMLGHRQSVVGYLNKPFKPQDLEHLLQAQGSRQTPVTKPAPGAGSSQDTVAAGHTGGTVMGAPAGQADGVMGRLDDPTFAKLLFKVTRGELTKLAEWLAASGARVEVAELAKRIIKPSVVRELRSEIDQACPNRRRPATGMLELCRPCVPERVAGFSSRVVGVPLREQERSFLGLVDGVRSVREIELELQLSANDAASVVDAVAGLGLVRLRSGLVGGNRTGTLWLIDELPGDFASDLAQHLGHFGRRWTLVRIRAADVAEEALRGTPNGVIVRSTTPDCVASLRAIGNFERVPLAAIYDDSQLAAGALLGAGADMALALPVRTSAIDSFLGLSCTT